jgi:hypothetical protein
MYLLAPDRSFHTSPLLPIDPCIISPVGGKDRRCVYNDGDEEYLSLEDLKRLAGLDPSNVSFGNAVNVTSANKRKRSTSKFDNYSNDQIKKAKNTPTNKKMVNPRCWRIIGISKLVNPRCWRIIGISKRVV